MQKTRTVVTVIIMVAAGLGSMAFLFRGVVRNPDHVGWVTVGLFLALLGAVVICVIVYAVLGFLFWPALKDGWDKPILDSEIDPATIQGELLTRWKDELAHGIVHTETWDTLMETYDNRRKAKENETES